MIVTRKADQYSPVGNLLSTTVTTLGTVTPSYFDTKPATVKSTFVKGWRPPLAYSRQVFGDGLWSGRASHKQVNPDKGWTILTWEGYPDISNSNYAPKWDGSAPPILWTNLTARAEVECKIKLKDQKVQYCTALAEASKTVEAIARTFNQLFAGYKQLRKGNLSGALKALNVLPRQIVKDKNGRITMGGAGKRVLAGSTGAFANRWLELQYGWLPLLGDLHGAYEDSRRSFLDRGFLVSAKRVITQAINESKDLAESNKLPCNIRTTGKAGVKVRLDYNLRSDALSTAATIGLTNPLEVAWELVPFSFILDWALPIGDWLSSMDADFGLTFKGGTKTQFYEYRKHGTCNYQGPTSFAGGTWQNAHWEREIHNSGMTRTVYSSTPFPIPYFKNPVSTLHAMNALSLGRALLSGSKIPTFVRN